MRQVFVQRVKEKEAELKEAEREVCRLKPVPQFLIIVVKYLNHNDTTSLLIMPERLWSLLANRHLT